MNAGGLDDESDDGLELGANINPAMPQFNGMAGDMAEMMPSHPSGYLQEMAGMTGPLPQPLPQLPPKPLTGWIQWFISLSDHDFLLEVDREFLSDKMNLLGLREHFSSKDKYKECLRLLSSAKVPSQEDLQNQKFLELNQDTSDLYCLVHNRFVQSAVGLAKIYSKYLQSGFGNCPRALCDRQKVLPVGPVDKLRVSRVKVFCPCCEESYLPRFQNINLDGFFFGTSLP